MRRLKVSYVGTGLFILAAIIVMAAKPFAPGLSDTAHIMLGGVLITLSIWIFRPLNLPYSMGGLFLAAFALAFKLTPAVVFSGFAQSSIWTLVPALFFGYALHKTGLGRRVALTIIRLFKPSYLSLIFAFVVIGVALSILTPSSTVRVAIIIPVAVQCCELCGLEKRSKGNSLILLTAFSMAILPGSGWMTGVLWGPIISGMVNAVPETAGLVTFDSWFSTLFVPVILSTILLVVGSLIFLKPKEGLSKDAIGLIRSQKLDKITRREATVGIILVAVFVMFLTSRFHGIPDAALCLAAVFAFFLFRALDASDFNVGVNWDLIVFIASALSLGPIFSATGISTWLAGIIVPAIKPIATNPWVFMSAIMVVMFVWRFIDVAFFIPTMSILIPILPDIQEAYHISPLIWVAVFVMAANCFFMAYQNMWAMMSKSIAGERSWENKHLGVYGIIYFAACMLALIAAIPMWISAGLFG
jgi:anion transporter